jgi:hypothetical protein
MSPMSNPSTVQHSAPTSGEKSRVLRTLQATRYECQHCYTHTFLVLRKLGEAKCSVCESYDLAPVED